MSFLLTFHKLLVTQTQPNRHLSTHIHTRAHVRKRAQTHAMSTQRTYAGNSSDPIEVQVDVTQVERL